MYYFFLCCTNTKQHFFSGSVPQERFFGIFWQNFEHFLKKWPAILWNGWPAILQTLQIFFLISKEYPTTILDVREASKSFNVNILIFFYPHFSGYFFPVDEPAFFFMKFWLEKQHVFSRFVFVWCQPHLESFFRSPITVLKNLWNQKCFKIISDHHAKKIKWFA